MSGNGKTGPERDSLTKWEVENGVLRIAYSDGSSFVPSADEIYRIAIEHEPSDDLPSPTVRDGERAITFSRIPLLLEIRIEAATASDASGLRVTAYAVGDEVEAQIADASSRLADHVVAHGSWYPFASGTLEEAKEIYRQVAIPNSGSISLRQYLTLLQLASAHTCIRDSAGDAASAMRQTASEETQLPKGFSGSLYSYQRNGWRWLEIVSSQGIGGILADEMGLGKTVQIAVLLAAEVDAGRTPCLVIATGTLLENWRRELEKFAPGLRTLVHHGAKRSGLPRHLRSHDVVITSYDILVRDLSLIRTIQWNIVVLDEAQAIKNPETKRSTAARRIPRRVGIAVTGTPVENRLGDLWSLADFALPGFLGERNAFESAFSNDPDGADTLEPFVSPILLRRKVSDVARDLPARIDIPQAICLTVEQAAAYDEMRLAILAEYGASATLVSLTRLRMFCAHPSLIDGRVGDPVTQSTKYERLCEILEEIVASGEKAIIFTSYTKMSDLLVGDLSQRFGIPTAFIDGRTAVLDRQTTVDRFGAVDGSAVLVLNPRAAGTGLNIVAANHVIHYNLEWNPAVEDQASARAYRRGQTRPVTVHRLFYADTVEEIMNQRLAAKRDLANRAVVGVDGEENNFADIAAALARSPAREKSDRV